MLRRWMMYGVFTCLLYLGFCEQISWAALPDPQLAIASMTLTVGEEVRDELIEGLKKFAESSAFATRVVHLRNDKRHYFCEFWRGDVHITVANPFNDAKEFSIAIYQTGTTPIPPPHIDALINDIKNVINELHDVTIDSVKK
jgi:hypothetical protein